LARLDTFHGSLRGWLRAVWRIPLLLVLTLGCLFLVLLGRGVFRIAPETGRRWIDRVYRFWGRWMAWTLGARVTVEGDRPDPPFLMVSNHLSYIDIFVLSSVTGAVFIAKAEIDGWPLIGLACRSVNTIFVNRENRRDVVRVSEKIQAALEAGHGVVLFAEGTTSHGATVQPFRTPLLAPAATGEIAVHQATLGYHTGDGTRAAVHSVCWWGDMELVPHVRQLARIPGFYATVKFGREPIHDPDRKRLAQRLHQAVVERFVPVTGAEEI
jgi:1-acyl-sn-glycerol-3-phosphate acyltransferase